MSLRSLFARFRNELEVWRRVWRDPRTPRSARILLGVAVAYAVTPFDIIPDFIPLLGQLDDMIILPLLVWLAMKLTPKQVIAEHRAAASSSYRPSVETPRGSKM